MQPLLHPMAIREAATPIRVVLIDDEADFLRLIRVRFELEHDIVVIGEAEEGETGVALALREQPDIVVMDVMMPRIDGFEATKRIKRSRPAVRVLAVDLSFWGRSDAPGDASQRSGRVSGQARHCDSAGSDDPLVARRLAFLQIPFSRDPRLGHADGVVAAPHVHGTVVSP
jgi:CheY-like chemotaxis protein